MLEANRRPKQVDVLPILHSSLPRLESKVFGLINEKERSEREWNVDQKD